MIVTVEGKEYTIREPKPETLRKYGLSITEWKEILCRQNYRCAICKGIPSTGKFVIDHQHVRNYKKLSPEKRKSYVRGELCWRCNYYFAGKGMCYEWAVNLSVYFREYEKRLKTQ